MARRVTTGVVLVTSGQPNGHLVEAAALPPRLSWADLAAMRDRAVHVVGLASTEGAAITHFLAGHGFSRLTVHDFLDGRQLRETFGRLHVGLSPSARDTLWTALEALPLERCFGEDYLDGILDAERIFAGQGWTLYEPNFPALGRAHASGIPFHSMTELYFGLSACPITAVTGSVGKSTTSRLIASMLEASGRQTYFAGNERHSVQVLEQLGALTPEDRLVLEVSNRQLTELAPNPDVAVITNIIPNHLEEHGGSFEVYREIKKNLVRNQEPDQQVVLSADDRASTVLAGEVPGELWQFSRTSRVERGAWLSAGRIRLSQPGADDRDLGPAVAHGLLGDHNVSNILAASVAAILSGAAPDALQGGLSAFVAPKHRLQLVWRAAGTAYYDDLNASSPHATIAAFHALSGPIIWIAGGDEKGLEVAALAREAAIACRLVLMLPGAGSERLLEAVSESRSGLPVERFDDLRAALVRAVALARPDDSVLLSPAFPGFFSRNYTGDGGYRALLRELAVEAADSSGDLSGADHQVEEVSP